LKKNGRLLDAFYGCKITIISLMDAMEGERYLPIPTDGQIVLRRRNPDSYRDGSASIRFLWKQNNERHIDAARSASPS
jgi:hypothetical protein